MEKIIYVVKRYELADTGLIDYPNVLQIFDEKAFVSQQDAQDYKNSLDPTDDGFEYTCPCGCGDVHWRSWEVEPLVLSLPGLPKQEKLGNEFAQMIEDNFWELVIK